MTKLTLLQIAKKHRPRGVAVRFRKDDYLIPAHATVLTDGSKEMYVPFPHSREALFIFLHECGHHHLGHLKPGYHEPTWLMEYEAEHWAMATMRAEGLAVPRSMIAEAKRYVAECARHDIDKGRAGPNAKVANWMTRRFKKKPKPCPNYRKPKKI